MSVEIASNSNSAAAAVTQRRATLWKRATNGVRRVALFVWKYFFGLLACQSFLGSILAVGWTYRVAQRAVLKRWWRQSHFAAEGQSFSDFAAASFPHHVRWPNWIVRQNAWNEIQRRAPAGPLSQLRMAFGSAAHSLWLNLKIGSQAIFNTWILTLPGCLLWLFAWYDGWNNSFNKGYEQAAIGPLTGIAGVILFIAAMFYVPMAQARQAATGQWRTFYQFRFVWGLIRRQWLACVGLAIFYTAFSVPVTLLKTMPEFFPQLNPSLADVTPERAAEILRQYFFWATLLVFAAYVILRWLAARIYAAGILDGVKSGAIPEDALAENEWEALHKLDLLQIRLQPRKPALLRIVTWAGSRAGRTTAGVLLVFIWFSFVAQIFIGEFFNSHPIKGWLNQPLVQLPWLRDLPPHLKRAAE